MRNYYTTEAPCIIIETDSAGIKLYNTSKKGIGDNSKQIDKLVRLNNFMSKITELGSSLHIDVVTATNKNDNTRFIEIYCNFLDSTTELSISSRELYLAKSKFEQIYYIKNIYLCISRYKDRMKTQNQFLKTLAIKYNCETLFEEYVKSNRSFQKKYNTEITENRNKIIAHFDKETSYAEYHAIISNYNAESTARMAIEFLDTQKILSQLLAILSSELLNKMSSNLEELKQYNNDHRQSIYQSIDHLKGTSAYDSIKKAIDKIYEKYDDIIK